MKYIVELDKNMTHHVYFKRWWFSRRKLIGTVDHGGILAVKDSVIKPHFISNFIRYDFINHNDSQYSKKGQKFI